MFRIYLKKEWCKECGLCADFCPAKVFDFAPGQTPVVAREAACIGCRTCERLCPDLAVRVEKEEKEL